MQRNYKVVNGMQSVWVIKSTSYSVLCDRKILMACIDGTRHGGVQYMHTKKIDIRSPLSYNAMHFSGSATTEASKELFKDRIV